MARTPRDDYPGAIHHVYGRGNGRQVVFRDDEDCRTFLSRLLNYRDITGIRVLAYCLMVNHYHLVTQTAEIPLEDFMQGLLGSYTRLFNDRWNTVGHLFQGRYEARRCKTDNDVRCAIRYVHLNPVEAGLVAAPDQWPWSGHRALLGAADPIMDAALAGGFFGGPEGYQAFMDMPLAKHERPALEAIAAESAPCCSVAELRTGGKRPELVRARRAFAVACLQAGYRRGEIAKFLCRSAPSITKLLKGES